MFFYNYVIGTGKMSVGIRLSPKERSGGGRKSALTCPVRCRKFRCAEISGITGCLQTDEKAVRTPEDRTQFSFIVEGTGYAAVSDGLG